MDLSLRLLADAANAQGAFKDFGTAITAASKVVADFAKESIKAFSDADRAQRQLQAAAGAYTNILNEQAEATKRKYAVDDDAIRRMDVLLLRYGAAPSQIQGVTEAVINLSAATGKDMNAAMEQLVRGVESGTGSLGKLGVHFKATGDFSKDLAAAVTELNKKFGGAGAADAESLDGRTRKVSLAMDDLKKSFGAMFDELDRKYGVLDKVAKGIDSITEAVKRNQDPRVRYAAEGGGNEAQVDSLFYGSAAGGTARTAGALAGGARVMGPEFRPDELAPAGRGTRGGSSAAKKSEAQQEAYLNAENEYLDRKWLMDREAEKHEEEHDQKMLEAKRQLFNAEEAMRIEKKKFDEQEQRDEEEHDEKMLSAHQKASKAMEDLKYAELEQTRQRIEQQEHLYASAGARIGQALIAGVFEAIDEAGQKDGDGWKAADKMVRSVIQAVFSAFGYGWLSSAAFGAMDANEQGNTAGMAGAAGSAASNIRYDSSTSYHEGGAVPRLHGGGYFARDERLAILQTDEHVLNRWQVANMGGHEGVMAAARGGSTRPLVIQAFDTSSILDFFGDRGGRGMVNAARANVGPLRLNFGRV